ncbi:MAG: hypothetical protein PHG66_06245 [Candidatus Colwellbacteria bacterium]|nr:hypothetical protein [Candidatus Colwellbacteria bacterium]
MEFDNDTKSIINDYVYAFDMYDEMADVHRDILSSRRYEHTIRPKWMFQVRKESHSRFAFNLHHHVPVIFRLKYPGEGDKETSNYWRKRKDIPTPKLWNDYRISLFTD